MEKGWSRDGFPLPRRVSWRRALVFFKIFLCSIYLLDVDTLFLSLISRAIHTYTTYVH